MAAASYSSLTRRSWLCSAFRILPACACVSSSSSRPVPSTVMIVLTCSFDEDIGAAIYLQYLGVHLAPRQVNDELGRAEPGADQFRLLL